MSKKNINAILKEAESLQRDVLYKSHKEYFAPFKDEVWVDLAVENAVVVTIEIHKLLTSYKDKCVKLIKKGNIFKDDVNIKKARRYKTHEYLDERYNRVIVDDIKDSLVELNKEFNNALKESYDKYITKGYVRDSAEIVYKASGMDFNFNKFHKDTSEYLLNKKIHWANQVAESTENKVKKILVESYEKGITPQETAVLIENVTDFSHKRAVAVARTEIFSTRMYVSYTKDMADASVTGFEWSSSGDGWVRPTHACANGQKRKKGEPFDVGGSKLLFPLDSSLGAVAKEVVNCRCTYYAITNYDDLKSETVYDAKDVATNQWLKRQSKEFQLDYLGGKGKKELFDLNLMDIDDSKKPLNEVVSNISKVKVKPKDISQVFDIPEHISDKLVDVATSVWLYGKAENKEMARTIHVNTGKEMSNAYGVYGKIDGESKNYSEWIDDINNAEINSRIIMHNHNNISGLSIADIKLFLNKKSVKAIFAVGTFGSLYGVEKVNGVVYDVDEIEKFYNNGLKEIHKIIKNDQEWDDLTHAEKLEKVNKLLTNLCNITFKRYNLKGGEWLNDEN